MIKESKKMKDKDLLEMKELGDISGVPYSTITYYAKEGLLPYQKEEGRNTRRRYPKQASLARLKAIGLLKKKYLPLKIIKEKLKE